MALQEFDFLQNHEDEDEQHLSPPLQFQDHMPTGQSHKEDAPDLLRPILTMPPVLLMGGYGPNSGIIPPSPLVEMPPTPDANQMPTVEYPEDDEPPQEFVVQDQIDIEVRYRIYFI